MQKKKGKRASPGRATPNQGAPASAGGRRILRALAHGTILAAGIAVVRFSTPEIDPRFEMFDPTLVDRLEPPITRYHE